MQGHGFKLKSFFRLPQGQYSWLVAACLAWIFGIVLQLQQSALWSPMQYAELLAVAGFGVVGTLLWRGRVKCGACLPVFFLTLVLCAFAFVGLRAAYFANTRLSPELAGKDVRVHATVLSVPKEQAWGSRFVLHIESPAGLPERILVAWYYPWGKQADPKIGSEADAKTSLKLNPGSVRAGQTWAFTLRLKDVHGNANPFGFDYELWLWEQGIGATAYVRDNAKTPAPVLLKEAVWSLARLRQNIRDAIFAQVQNTDTAGLVAALSVGDQASIDNKSWQVFRDTGVAHLVSISGLHITMFSALTAVCIGWFWRFFARRGHGCLRWPLPHVALGGGLLLALGYALLSGFALPAQRTILMLALFSALRYLGLHWPWPAVWLLALALLLGFDPWGMYQAGFWLSFVAVGVLFAAGPRLITQPNPDEKSKLAQAPIFTGPMRERLRLPLRILSMVGRLLREQAVVMLALSPLLFLFFHQIALVGLLANLLAVPWVTLLLAPLSILGMLYPPFWSLAADLGQVLYMCLQAMATWPWAQWQHAAVPAPYGVIFTLLASVGGLLMVLPWPWILRALGLGLMLPLLLSRPISPALGAFTVLAPDIGQGSAVLIQTARHSLLFDAGPGYRGGSDAGERLLVPLLQALGARLNILLLSHEDKDHVGGAKSIQNAQPQAQVLGSTSDLRNCTAPRSWTWDGVHFQVLHPQPQVWRENRQAMHSQPQQNSIKRSKFKKARKTNALSCVLLVQGTHGSALLTGDIGVEQEAGLVARYGDLLRADTLMVPHHGSKTSSSALFLEAVAPKFAVVQAGYRNPFGHPHSGVLARYADLGIAVFSSSRCGAWSWSSAQPAESQCERHRNVRYWGNTP